MSELDQAIQRALRKVAERIRDRAFDEAPYITGALRKSITVSEEGDKVIVWAGGGGAPYAPFVHEGTRPHVIKPVRKKVLADAKKGIIFGKKVNHPGTKPNPFLLRAAAKTAPEIDRLIGKDISEAILIDVKKQLENINVEIKL